MAPARRVAPEKPPCGVAHRLLGTTKRLSARLAWHFFGRQRWGELLTDKFFTMHKHNALILLITAAALAACSRGENAATEPEITSDAVFPDDHFLQYLNPQHSLAAGDYEIVAGTNTAGAAGSFTLRIERDDGSVETRNGTWAASGGASASSPQNPRFNLAMPLPGGAKVSLTSTDAQPMLFLVDDNGAVVGSAAADGAIATLDMPRSRTDAAEYTAAYYAAVDPLDQRTTLTGFRTVNGFDDGPDAHIIFRDTKDLGYGRDMYFKLGENGAFALFVRNFQVQAVPGEDYGPLNLDAAIAADTRFHIGTNAIEFGPVDADADGNFDDTNGDEIIDIRDYFPKFYTYEQYAPFKRRERVDLDGRGDKAMPIPCIVCHGGRADPLLPDGSFPRLGDTLSRMQGLDVESFEFLDIPGRTRADQEAAFKLINSTVLSSYQPYATPANGEWDGSRAIAQIEAWYGGEGLPSDTFVDGYVPDAWRPNPATGSPPPGADEFYREVIAENCRTCHLLRGLVHQDDIDFTTYDKFASYSETLQRLVFDHGKMPLALITFQNLNDTDGLLEQLAAFIPDFNRLGPNQELLRPGRPIAEAGPSRVAPSPVQLMGVGSRYFDSAQWAIIDTPAGATASLSDAAAINPTLTTDRDGDYTLQITVSGLSNQTHSDTTTVTIDSGQAPPNNLRFFDDIQPLMESDCVQCHSATPTQDVLPPVFYTVPADGENRDVYAEVLARVNFADPGNSPLLTKPLGEHHNGGVRPGFDLTGDRNRYDTFVNWIMAGAPR